MYSSFPLYSVCLCHGYVITGARFLEKGSSEEQQEVCVCLDLSIHRTQGSSVGMSVPVYRVRDLFIHREAVVHTR